MNNLRKFAPHPINIAADDYPYTITQIKSALDEMLVSYIISQCRDYLNEYGAVPPPEIAHTACLSATEGLIRTTSTWLTANDWELMAASQLDDALEFVYRHLHHGVIATTRRNLAPTANYVIFPVGSFEYITSRRVDIRESLIDGSVIDFSRFVKNERLSSTPATSVFFETEKYLAIDLEMYDNIYSSLCGEWHKFNNA